MILNELGEVYVKLLVVAPFNPKIILKVVFRIVKFVNAPVIVTIKLFLIPVDKTKVKPDDVNVVAIAVFKSVNKALIVV